jgi:hypothetical protein
LKTLSAFKNILLVCMQDGRTPAYAASCNGHTETLALLLLNKADVNAASKVQRIKIFLDLEID